MREKMEKSESDPITHDVVWSGGRPEGIRIWSDEAIIEKVEEMQHPDESWSRLGVDYGS